MSKLELIAHLSDYRIFEKELLNIDDKHTSILESQYAQLEYFYNLLQQVYKVAKAA